MNYYKLILIFVAVLIQACQLTNTSYPSQWDLKPDNNQAIISRLEIAKSLGFDANGCYTKNPIYASQVSYLRDIGVTQRKTSNCSVIQDITDSNGCVRLNENFQRNKNIARQYKYSEPASCDAIRVIHAKQKSTDIYGCFIKAETNNFYQTYLKNNNIKENIKCHPKYMEPGCFKSLTKIEKVSLKRNYGLNVVCDVDIKDKDLKQIIYDDYGFFKKINSHSPEYIYLKLANLRKLKETQSCIIRRDKIEKEEEIKRLNQEKERERIAEEEKRRVTELKIKILKRQEKIRKEEIKSTSAKMFSKERKTCATLGFKVGTPKHAECVLKLIEQ